MKHISPALFVLVVLASASACTSTPTPAPTPPVIAPTVASTVISTKPAAVPTAAPTKPAAPAPTAVPTLAAPFEIKPDKPLGDLKLLFAVPVAKVWFDTGLETEFLRGFPNGARQFVNLVTSQLELIKGTYPGLRQAISLAQNEADVFASDSWATYYGDLIKSGQIKYMTKEMLDEEFDEIWTVGKAFGLARVYLRLKLVDWASVISRGMTGTLNTIPLIFLNPEILCTTPDGGSRTILFLCGVQSGKFSKPL